MEELRNIAIEKLKNIKKDVGEVQSVLDKLDDEVDSLKRKLPEKVDFDKFKIFLRRPYTIIPAKSDSWYVIVPKFIPFSVGTYDHTEGEYVYYMLNRYTQWLGEIPEWIKEEVKLPESMKITFVDGLINFEEGKEEEIRKKFGNYLTSVSKGTGRVKVGNEFELIAEIIKKGSLPFAPHPVDEKDIRKDSGKIKFEGEYSFQKEAIEKFMQYGCVSIHYPTGAGKDVIATYLLDIIKVDNLPNLYIAPNLTILEQMEKVYFPTFAPRLLEEMKDGKLILSTYQNYENLKDKEYGLVVFSENHVLPADTFSKLATLKTKYRIGASACVFEGTQILCNDDWEEVNTLKNPVVYSYSNIENALIKEKALCNEVEWSDKLPFFVTTYSKKKIFVTDDHPFLIWRNGVEVWVLAKELKKDDLVKTITNTPTFNKKLKIRKELFMNTFNEKRRKHLEAFYLTQKLRKKGYGSKRVLKVLKKRFNSSFNAISWLYGNERPIILKKLERVEELSKNGNLIAKFLGFAFGDSHLRSDEYRLTFTVSKDEVKEIVKSLERLGIKSSVRKKKNKNSYSIDVWDYTFTRLLNMLGLPKGNKTKSKLEVFDIIKKDFTREFLSGLFGAEGTPPYLRKIKNNIAKQPSESILAMNTEDEENLNSFFHFIESSLNEFGIGTTLKISGGWKRKDGFVTKKFELRIKSNMQNILKFLHLIEFSFSPDKQIKANQTLAYLLLKNQLIKERESKIKSNSKEIPYSTLNSWANNKRKSVELRNVAINTPPTSLETRWEGIYKIGHINFKKRIFDLRVPETENFIANGFIVHNSPYREDGRTELIWALSGIPIGMAWSEILKKLGKDYHDIYVHILPNERDKLRKVQDLFDSNKKTLIFTWRLDIGKKIAEMLGIPFISGETKNRIEIIKNNRAFVISSVGELGISIKDLEHIIEVDFLFGSKRESIQRTGRLLHSEVEKAKRHDIIFSEDEYYKYGKRLRSLEEKGFFPVIMPYTSKLEFKEPKKSLKKRGKKIW